jgi:hypothetical protein
MASGPEPARGARKLGMRVHDASALAELLVCSAEEEAAAAISLGEALAVCGRAGAVPVRNVRAGGRPTSRPLPPRARAAARVADEQAAGRAAAAEAVRVAALEEAKRQGLPLPRTRDEEGGGVGGVVSPHRDSNSSRRRGSSPSGQRQRQPSATAAASRPRSSAPRAMKQRQRQRQPHAEAAASAAALEGVDPTPLGHTARLGVKRTVFWPAKVIQPVGPVAGAALHRDTVGRGSGGRRLGLWEAGSDGPPGGWLAAGRSSSSTPALDGRPTSAPTGREKVAQL